MLNRDDFEEKYYAAIRLGLGVPRESPEGMTFVPGAAGYADFAYNSDGFINSLTFHDENLVRDIVVPSSFSDLSANNALWVAIHTLNHGQDVSITQRQYNLIGLDSSPEWRVSVLQAINLSPHVLNVLVLQHLDLSYTPDFNEDTGGHLDLVHKAETEAFVEHALSRALSNHERH